MYSRIIESSSSSWLSWSWSMQEPSASSDEHVFSSMAEAVDLSIRDVATMAINARRSRAFNVMVGLVYALIALFYSLSC